MLLIAIKEKAVKTIGAVQTARSDKNGEKGNSSEYLGNLVQVFYIWYLITFRNKSMLIFFDSSDASSEVNTIYPTFV